MINPADRTTWPSGDPIWRFCQAIAIAEGYGADPNNAPTSHHNPGDLGPADTGYAGEEHGGSVVSKMPTDEQGWQDLYNKISRVFAGMSHTYHKTMTIRQFAELYAGDSVNWSRNVAADLNVPEDTRLIDWYQAQVGEL